VLAGLQRQRLGRRAAALVVAALIIMTALGTFAAPAVDRYLGVAPPRQFHQPLSGVAAARLPPLLGVAHNAGNHPTTAAVAARSGAHIVEVDVNTAHGELVARRDQPLPWLAELVFAGMSLTDAWRHAAPADSVLLDLKHTGKAFLDDIVAFVSVRQSVRHVLISSPEAADLRYLRPRLPTATLLFTLAWPSDVARLAADAALPAAIDGVSAYEELVTPELVSWLHVRELKVFAWPVNDGQRLSGLARIGVDAVTTDNVAVLHALADSTRRSARPIPRSNDH
jgi:glycerophosphoryl diester phosphodiesterase